MEQRWLKCIDVVPGMFTDERAVTVARLGGMDESFFVPQSEVQDDGRLLRVRVTKSGAHTWATLPTSEQTQIAVSEDQLVEG